MEYINVSFQPICVESLFALLSSSCHVLVNDKPRSFEGPIVRLTHNEYEMQTRQFLAATCSEIRARWPSITDVAVHFRPPTLSKTEKDRVTSAVAVVTVERDEAEQALEWCNEHIRCNVPLLLISGLTSDTVQIDVFEDELQRRMNCCIKLARVRCTDKPYPRVENTCARVVGRAKENVQTKKSHVGVFTDSSEIHHQVKSFEDRLRYLESISATRPAKLKTRDSSFLPKKVSVEGVESRLICLRMRIDHLKSKVAEGKDV